MVKDNEINSPRDIFEKIERMQQWGNSNIWWVKVIFKNQKENNQAKSKN